MSKKVGTYGELLQRLLADAGVSAYRLSKLAGVPAPSLSLIASNKRKPNVDTLERILRAAGKNWSWLDENLIPAQLPKADD